MNGPQSVSTSGRTSDFLGESEVLPESFGVVLVSIIRIGLAETKKFAEGYAAIFGTKKKKEEAEKPASQDAQTKDESKKTAKPAKKKDKE